MKTNHVAYCCACSVLELVKPPSNDHTYGQLYRPCMHYRSLSLHLVHLHRVHNSYKQDVAKLHLVLAWCSSWVTKHPMGFYSPTRRPRRFSSRPGLRKKLLQLSCKMFVAILRHADVYRTTSNYTTCEYPRCPPETEETNRL